MFLKLGQRRDFFVKKWFQTRMICYYLFVLITGGGALAYVVHKRAAATLRYCLFRGHVSECNSWEILRDEVVKTNLAATVIIIVLAVLAVLFVSWSVARSSRAVRDNVRATLTGRDPGSWVPPPRPHEFQNLQARIAAGIAAHQEHVGELRRNLALLRERIREASADLELGRRGLSSLKIRELHSAFANLKSLYRSFKIG